MNRIRSIQSGCSIIDLAPNGAELSKDISKGSIKLSNAGNKHIRFKAYRHKAIK